jgi:hypothetical protein
MGLRCRFVCGYHRGAMASGWRSSGRLTIRKAEVGG